MQARFFVKDYFLIWLILLLMGLFLRPLTPVDETRAVSVAWEMWQRGDFLVPHLNGTPYSHKPPLLQWCIHLLWLTFGVSEWSARLAAPLFALGSLVLTANLARRLWPGDEASVRLAPLMLLAMPVWALWSTLTLYDMLAAFCTLLGLHGIIRAGQGESRSGWILFGLGIGLGLLAKGPAILLMVLPPALFAPWWLNSKPESGWGSWYRGVLLGVLLGAGIGLAWALPAGYAGGDEYRRLIFWGQSAGRIANSFAHRRPIWWYLAISPLLWFPWTFWPPLWRSARRLTLDFGLRFCAIQCLFVLAAFSLISGKQIHYVLPMFPAAALFAARALAQARPVVTRIDQAPVGLVMVLLALGLLLLPLLGQDSDSQAGYVAAKAPLAAKLILLAAGVGLMSWPPPNPQAGVRILGLSLLGLMFAVHLIYRQAGWPYYFMQPFADRLAAVEKTGAPIAHWLKYHGDFNFLGRLRQPIVEIGAKEELLDWLNAHPQGYLVLVRQPEPSLSEEGTEFAQFYRGSRRIMLWKSSELLARPQILHRLVE